MKDNILVEQTLAGDKQAFNSLIADYYADIYSIILSWVKNPEDAKDLAQDVFISAYLDLPSLKDHKLFYSWIRQIARHKCQNWKRKQIDFIPLDNNLISREPSADEVLILREMLAKVMEAINSLPESEKRLLKEHYLDGVSYEELESRHGVSAKVLVMRLVRVRRKIRDQLEKTLSASVAFLHDHTKIILTGGTEIVKLSVKTKLIAGGIAVMLATVGTGVIILDHQQPEQIVSKPIAMTQKVSGGSSIKTVSSKKNVFDENIKKPKDNQNKEESLSKDEEDLKKWIAEINIDSSNIDSEASLHKDSKAQEQSLSTEQIDPEKYYSQFDKVFDQGPVPLNMVGIPIRDARGYGIENSKGQRLPDGTMLVYYRRKDGSLIRKVEKPDGTILRWVIGWTDLTPYYEIASKSWSDE